MVTKTGHNMIWLSQSEEFCVNITNKYYDGMRIFLDFVRIISTFARRYIKRDICSFLDFSQFELWALEESEESEEHDEQGALKI